jgi:hypothetical protein
MNHPPMQQSKSRAWVLDPLMLHVTTGIGDPEEKSNIIDVGHVSNPSVVHGDFWRIRKWEIVSALSTTSVEHCIAFFVKDINNKVGNKTLYIDRIVKELKGVCKQYSRENWDGYGAQPISEQACNDAEKFVQMLPEYKKRPEITPVPDGDISLEWYGGEKKVFFVTFHGNRTVEYIGAFGEGDKVAGRETLAEGVSENILHYIKRINLTSH